MDLTHATHPPGAPRPCDSGPDMNEALHRVIIRRGIAEEFLDQVARQLAAHEPTAPLTTQGWTRALLHAANRVLNRYPRDVADAAADRALITAPPIRHDISRGEYALILRRSAKGL